MPIKRIILKAHEEQRILSGHPWVYDNEIVRVLDTQANPAVLEPGELAEVESSRKEYLGRAFVNPNSKITARIYSPSKDGVDKGFFKHRIRKAILARFCYNLQRESARLVFAEADFLPGLIIDRFVGWPLDTLQAAVKDRPLSFENAAALSPPASWLSVQFLAYGMDARRELILDALEEVLAAPLLPGMEPLGAPTGIVEKSGAKVRELEGLPLREGLVRGYFPPSGIVIFENDLPFAVHLEEGQKTGHFLDQKDNRHLAAACLSSLSLEGKKAPRVLDAFSYTGCFGIHAARAGAESVVCVDVSAAALETLKINAALNGVSDRIKTVEADVFEFLRTAERRKERYDLIILDPPAFAKTRQSLEGAIRGYKEINLRAISMLSKGGILVTSSCSQAMDEANFRKMVTEAAADAGRRLVETDFRRQSADHPILVGYDESFYLKCGFYRAVD
jgi:23S rRNA (cytosine1962-C5)-methyltransferase